MTALFACRPTERHAKRVRKCMSLSGTTCENGPVRMSSYGTTCDKSPKMHVVRWNDMQKRPCSHVVLRDNQRKEPGNACRQWNDIQQRPCQHVVLQNDTRNEPANARRPVERHAKTALFACLPTERHVALLEDMRKGPESALFACRSTERHATRARKYVPCCGTACKNGTRTCMSFYGTTCKHGPVRMSFYRTT